MQESQGEGGGLPEDRVRKGDGKTSRVFSGPRERCPAVWCAVGCRDEVPVYGARLGSVETSHVASVASVGVRSVCRHPWRKSEAQHTFVE